MIPTDKHGAHVTSVAPQGTTFHRRADDMPEIGKAQSPKTLRPNSKRASLLRAFLELGDKGMNCFQAANQYHDYVLRSSISDFRRQLGIEFHRQYETVQGHNGGKVDCCRYWLSAAGAEKARELLGRA